ncbi:MAG: hypothetical protein J6Q17_09090 [Clostridia bacterium]|nr:hypothetical protein [Clostridia bacterium]
MKSSLKSEGVNICLQIVLSAIIILCLLACERRMDLLSESENGGNGEFAQDSQGMVEEQQDNDSAGGTFMGDELYSPYDFLTGSLVYQVGTFTERSDPYCREYEVLWNNDRNATPCLMYYLAHEMELTSEDLIEYYSACGIENVPDSLLSGILADSPTESMKMLKDPYSFYHEGKIYTVYDLYDLQDAAIYNDIVNDPENKDIWNHVRDYVLEINMKNDNYYSKELVSFIEMNVGKFGDGNG